MHTVEVYTPEGDAFFLKTNLDTTAPKNEQLAHVRRALKVFNKRNGLPAHGLVMKGFTIMP